MTETVERLDERGRVTVKAAYRDAAIERFDAEGVDVLRTAAQALQEGSVASPFDAVHLAETLHRSSALATADEGLWRTRFPTERF